MVYRMPWRAISRLYPLPWPNRVGNGNNQMLRTKKKRYNAMKNLQLTLLCLSIAALSFALGWYMRGDMIYSAMFNQSAVVLGDLK